MHLLELSGSIAYLGGIIVVVGVTEVGGGHPTPQDNGAVEFGRQLKIHHLRKEEGVLVDFEVAEVDELLSQGFAIAYVDPQLLDSGDDSQGRGSLTDMLAGGGYINSVKHWIRAIVEENY
jgi:hypothetical protein